MDKLKYGLAVVAIVGSAVALTFIPNEPTTEKVCGKYWNADHYCYQIERNPQ